METWFERLISLSIGGGVIAICVRMILFFLAQREEANRRHELILRQQNHTANDRSSRSGDLSPNEWEGRILKQVQAGVAADWANRREEIRQTVRRQFDDALKLWASNHHKELEAMIDKVLKARLEKLQLHGRKPGTPEDSA